LSGDKDKVFGQLRFALFVIVTSTSAFAEGQRVPFAPTSIEELPSAIFGEGTDPLGEYVNYFANDSETRGYLAVPEGEGPFPAVILIHGWTGVLDRYAYLADNFAAEGYVALAADLYSGRIGTTIEEKRALMLEIEADQGRIIQNLNAAAEFLKSRPDVSGKIATIGWCMGGAVALSYALGGEHHDATAIFYGRLVEDPEVLRTITHEIYGTFAREDASVPVDHVERFIEALRAAGVPNDVHIYDEVEHAFWQFVEEDPEVNTAPALDAWQRLKAYLARTLGSKDPAN
jgi:carboxymethylenebutenolidase